MRWDIDATHSSVGFAVRHMMVATVRGRFGGVSGSIELDPSSPETASALVRIDAASVDTGMPKRDDHLRSADFFDAATHPEIVFRARGAQRVGADRYRLDGDLTIRGTTRPISLDAELAGPFDGGKAGTRVGLSATGRIDRKDFGLNWNVALEAGGWLVSDQVRLEIELAAVRALESAAA